MVSVRTPISRQVAGRRVRPGGVADDINVAGAERVLSLVGGGVLAFLGLRRGDLPGFALAAAGGGLVYRGLSGHCHAYGLLGINTAEHHNAAASVAAGRGAKVVEGVTIDRPVEEVYRFWRDFSNLPRFMKHLLSVTTAGNRSHWTARGPAGVPVSWDAEIINEEPNSLIAWRSLEGSTVGVAGSVHFEPAPGDRGTEVTVTLKYDAPGGKAGRLVAWLSGEEPSVQIAEDLRRLKQLLEAGWIPTPQAELSAAR